MKETTAATMNSLLKSVVTSGTGTNANFRSDLDICGKTGTTDEDKDRWFIGYTPYYAAATWVGYDQPKEITGVSGNPALNLWKAVMVQIHKGKAGKTFDAANVGEITTYCTTSNKLATDACSRFNNGASVRYETFKKGEEPTETCDIHKQLRFDNSTGMIANEYCPEENLSWIAVEKQEDGSYIDSDGETVTNYICNKHDAISNPKPTATPGYTVVNPNDPNISNPGTTSPSGYYTYNNDGTYYYTLPDGSYYYYKPDGTYFHFYTDGRYDYVNPNGGSYYYDGNKYYSTD
jgi:penicillin-binding protein 1A